MNVRDQVLGRSMRRTIGVAAVGLCRRYGRPLGPGGRGLRGPRRRARDGDWPQRIGEIHRADALRRHAPAPRPHPGPPARGSGRGGLPLAGAPARLHAVPGRELRRSRPWRVCSYCRPAGEGSTTATPSPTGSKLALLGAGLVSVMVVLDPMGQLRPWATLMVIFDVIHWSIGGLFFARILED